MIYKIMLLRVLPGAPGTALLRDLQALCAGRPGTGPARDITGLMLRFVPEAVAFSGKTR